jgi:hypothetical protein
LLIGESDWIHSTGNNSIYDLFEFAVHWHEQIKVLSTQRPALRASPVQQAQVQHEA